MNRNAALLEKFKKWPGGLWLFSMIICFRAPYFSSIRPRFTLLEVGEATAVLRKRRAVQNHIGTVHAIAIANLCEFVAGTALEMSTPETHRWIPKSMKINYLKKAATDLTATTIVRPSVWPDSGSVIAHVDVRDTHGVVVVDADIEMYISKKKPKDSQ